MIIIPIVLLPIMLFLPTYLANPQRSPVRVVVIQNDDTSDSFVRAMEATEVTHVTILNPSANITRLVQSGDFEAGIILPANFSRVFEDNAATVTVTIVVDEASARGEIAQQIVGAIISAYSDQIVEQRVRGEGLPPEALTPIKTRIISVTTTGPLAFLLAFLLPLFLGIYSVSGGIYYIMDATAGEKERRTLEALLTMPATRLEILIGKFMVATIIALASTAFALIGLAIGAALLVQSFGGPSGQAVILRVSPANLALIGIASLLLAMTSASLEMLIAIFARNFKEAQNFISPLTIVVVIPALAILYVQEQTLRTLSLLPFVNSMLVIRNAVLDRVVVGDLALQLGSSFAYMIVALLLAARIFSSERAMFRS
jgi:sodium transport system permease protein